MIPRPSRFVLAMLVATTACSVPPPPSISEGPPAQILSWSSLEEALRANMRPIAFDRQSMSGPGADFLIAEGRSSRFFVIGEQHVSREIPYFTTALFRALHEVAGYDHLALEQDAALGLAVSQAHLRGREQAIFAYARRFPNAFTFSNDEEISMIADVSAVSRARSGPIWSLDQIFGILHVLDRLRPAASSPAAAARLERLIEQVRPHERERFASGRRLISGDLELPADLDRLRAFLAAPSGSEADFLIGQLELSIRLYADNATARAGAPTKYRQTHDREENMKQLFMYFYHSAVRAGDKDPRVVLKAGHQHSIRGENWSGVLSVGDFVSALALSLGSKSFHIAVYMNNTRAGYYDLLSSDPNYAPLVRPAPQGRSVVIDLRPLRHLAYANRLPGLSPELRRVIFGFDAALLIADGERGSYERSGGRP